ncbi:MAG TPA: Rrf2 family transcriptional regulator [Clostridiaceae bacterium]|nr:Rrf2 family transcriptional regulator [Clostridiaceae bacterium]
MRISAKGRYALAAMIYMAENHESGECITVISISEKLGISKIYLEQVFAMLKKEGLVNSVKGAQGGYQLARNPRQITALDVLSAVEISLFEPTETTVQDKAPEIESAIKSAVFDAMDSAVRDSLEKVTLYDLVSVVEENKKGGELMYFI